MRAGIAVALLITRNVAQADCTDATPCPLGKELQLEQRVASEQQMAARMANAPASEQNIRAYDLWMENLKSRVELEREHFSKLCALWSELDGKLKNNGSRLTSTLLHRFVGQPDSEATQREGALDGKIWVWDGTGPLSGGITFGVTFIRSAGSSGPWAFAGCQWCASASRVAAGGCMQLPWRP